MIALLWVLPAAAAGSGEPVDGSPRGFTSWSINDPGRPWALRANLEVGFAGVLSHTIQFGKDGTKFDYKNEGGQNVLVPLTRISAELEIFKHHNFILLYQPIDLRTEAVLTRAVRADGLDFPSGTPVNIRYGFDYYRFSYTYDLFADPRRELSFGISLQVRNAANSITSADGTLRRTQSNLGLVPILKVRGRYSFDNGFFVGLDADAIYVEGKIITGSTNSFVGALYDVSVRSGVQITRFADVYASLRFLGGGARGTSSEPVGQGDGYVDNWLYTLTGSIGIGLR